MQHVGRMIVYLNESAQNCPVVKWQWFHVTYPNHVQRTYRRRIEEMKTITASMNVRMSKGPQWPLVDCQAPGNDIRNNWEQRRVRCKSISRSHLNQTPLYRNATLLQTASMTLRRVYKYWEHVIRYWPWFLAWRFIAKGGPIVIGKRELKKCEAGKPQRDATWTRWTRCNLCWTCYVQPWQ